MEITKEQAEEFANGPQPTQEDLDNIVDIVSDSPLGENIVQTDFVKEAKKRAKKRKGTAFGFENRSDPIFEKTVDIFELIKKTKITLDIKNYDTGDMTEVYDGYDQTNQHSITIGKRADENIKTSLERGLAYIAFDTSTRQFKGTVGKLSEFAKIEHQGKIQELLMTAYASLEARRVNSCMGHVFKGFDERRRDADLIHAKKLFGDDFKINDPISALQCAQLGLNDLVEKSEFKRANEYMKDVERTSGAGSIILTNEYVEEVVKPWYLENFGKEPEGEGGDGKGKNGNPAPQGGEGGNSGEGETDPNAEGETDQEGEGNGNPRYDDRHENAKDWKGKEPTDKQKEYIKRHGPKDEPVPKTRGGAYDLVAI